MKSDKDTMEDGKKRRVIMEKYTVQKKEVLTAYVARAHLPQESATPTAMDKLPN